MATELTSLRKNTRGHGEDGVDTSWHKAVFALLSIASSTAALKNSGFFYVGFMNEFGIERGRASLPSSILSSSVHASGKQTREKRKLHKIILVFEIEHASIY